MIWGIEPFHDYIYGRNFTLLIDHDGLKFLKSLENSKAMCFRWILRLNEYDFNVLPKAWILMQMDSQDFNFSQLSSRTNKKKAIFKLLRFPKICRKLKKPAKNYKNRKEWFLHRCAKEGPVLIKQYHERAHQSASSVVKNLKLRYYWPEMVEEVAQVCLPMFFLLRFCVQKQLLRGILDAAVVSKGISASSNEPRFSRTVSWSNEDIFIESSKA
jgi:hypothetical protein